MEDHNKGIIYQDINGKLNKLRIDEKGLLPLFEAVSNSIHSIQDRNGQGVIKIEVEKAFEIFSNDNSDNTPYVKNITIIDNGIGFNEENYQSFLQSDSLYKFKRGGKGVGRFTWLKAFQHAEIESVYIENSISKKRTFKFSANLVPITSMNVEESIEAIDNLTKIQLVNLKEQYKKKFPYDIEKLTNLLIIHNIQHLISKTLPELLIYEKGNEESKISINDYFINNIIIDHHKDNFSLKLNGEEILFNIDYIKQKKQGSKVNHKIFYTAHERVVTNIALSELISDFKCPFKEKNGDEFMLSIIISSDFLNEKVNEERDAFNIPEKRRFKNNTALDDIIFEDINEQIIDKAKNYLKYFLEEIRNDKLSRIKELVTTKLVNYRPLLNYPDYLADINMTQTENAIEIELHKLKNRISNEAKTNLNNLINKDYSNINNLKEYKNEISEAISTYGAIGQSELVNYIIHRKVILNILDKALVQQSDGKFALEELVHNIVFPMKKTSDDIEYEQQNLWLIDEKLSFHRRLASDIYLNRKSRPDILIDMPSIWIDNEKRPYQNIVIIEFKRPNRDDYSSNEKSNPYSEVLKSIDQLKSNRAKENGKIIEIDTNCRFFCYIIADTTPTLQKHVINHYDFKPMTDRIGFYHYHEALKAYFEIIPYSKLLQDAQDRNRVLFAKLKLPENL